MIERLSRADRGRLDALAAIEDYGAHLLARLLRDEGLVEMSYITAACDCWRLTPLGEAKLDELRAKHAAWHDESKWTLSYGVPGAWSVVGKYDTEEECDAAAERLYPGQEYACVE